MSCYCAKVVYTQTKKGWKTDFGPGRMRGVKLTTDLVNAKTGRVYWTYDMMAAVWGSPLIVDGKIYLGDEDGDMAVFALSPKLKLLAENNMGNSVYAAAVVADDVLYIATRSHLIAIGATRKTDFQSIRER